jgi:hypothetical protein
MFGELSRARGQEGKVAGRHDVKLGLTRKAFHHTRDADRVNAAVFGSEFRAPDLQSISRPRKRSTSPSRSQCSAAPTK